jgi:hypothetical protein
MSFVVGRSWSVSDGLRGEAFAERVFKWASWWVFMDREGWGVGLIF